MQLKYKLFLLMLVVFIFLYCNSNSSKSSVTGGVDRLIGSGTCHPIVEPITSFTGGGANDSHVQFRDIDDRFNSVTNKTKDDMLVKRPGRGGVNVGGNDDIMETYSSCGCSIDTFA